MSKILELGCATGQKVERLSNLFHAEGFEIDCSQAVIKTTVKVRISRLERQIKSNFQIHILSRPLLHFAHI